MRTDIKRAAWITLAMVCASLLAVWITPRTFIADQQRREKLVDIVPTAFGDWRVDTSIVPVPPSPDLQQVLDATYDEIVALTYRNSLGQRVMLSMAYGRNQHKGMNTHRPEICYPAQGFRIVKGSATGEVEFGTHRLPVTRVVAAMGPRNEPITYWLMVGDQVTTFGYPQRVTTFRYGLRGLIPDGVLVRVSSVEADNQAAFDLQGRFIADLLNAVPPAGRNRIIGST